MRFHAAIILILMCMVAAAGAIPATQPVTDISNLEATFHATGGAGNGWFEWGSQSGKNYFWSSINQTVAGNFEYTQFGPPMLSDQTYYVRACDDTGCGAEVSFMTSAATAPNKTNFGTGIFTIYRSGFNITQTAGVIVRPYTAQITAPISYAILFMFIFIGLWLRPKDIFIPAVMAMVFGGMLWWTGGLGIDSMFADIGQGLLYAAIAGIAFSWFTR